jgi:hypothetical protein
VRPALRKAAARRAQAATAATAATAAALGVQPQALAALQPPALFGADPIAQALAPASKGRAAHASAVLGARYLSNAASKSHPLLSAAPYGKSSAGKIAYAVAALALLLFAGAALAPALADRFDGAFLVREKFVAAGVMMLVLALTLLILHAAE